MQYRILGTFQPLTQTDKRGIFRTNPMPTRQSPSTSVACPGWLFEILVHRAFLGWLRQALTELGVSTASLAAAEKAAQVAASWIAGCMSGT